MIYDKGASLVPPLAAVPCARAHTNVAAAKTLVVNPWAWGCRASGRFTGLSTYTRSPCSSCMGLDCPNMKPPSVAGDTVMPLTWAQTYADRISKPVMDVTTNNSACPKQMWLDCMIQCEMAKDRPCVDTTVLLTSGSTKGNTTQVP